ncbi:MAG: DegT/DnrJ/EryC1/StrS aminotransferase family protein [Deltaproteobacteria bacterium]|nr:DegT/DnrJ/EryC1/StrS aminotransferase family protein [Deltaproteobacteria bacterium]MBW2094944.1 DegT/DnrJ/EryC1/StrS aminotransferase family protein [Deltaproteobacteria bacterium]
MRIPLIKPFIDERVKRRVLDVLESGYLAEGPVTAELETICRDYIGCGHVVAVSSCTVGLEMALRCLHVGPGDEVIVPDYTYPATADAVALVGARTIIVDVDPDTMLIDYDALEAAIGSRTKAVIPVSLFGNPLDYDRLLEIKNRHGIYILEDAACALGAEYRGRKVGSFSDITVFSLHPRKFITTGEGGLLATDRDSWADWLRSYKKFGMETGKDRAGTVFRRIGTNYKLSDVLAAIGLGQMESVKRLLEERRYLAEKYIRLLKDTGAIRLPKTTTGGRHSFQSFCIFTPKRDEILLELRRKGIEVQIGTYSLHLQPAFASSSQCEHRNGFSGSNFAYSHCMTLPLYHGMSEGKQREVVEAIVSCLGN